MKYNTVRVFLKIVILLISSFFLIQSCKDAVIAPNVPNNSTTTTNTTTTDSAGPAAPDNITATTLSSSSVQLNWTDNSDNEEGFDIYRSIESMELTEFTYIGSVGENITTYTDTGLPAAKNIFYFVVSYIGTAISDSEDLVCAVTSSRSSVPAPTNISASDGTEAYEIFITWTWSEGASSYRVYGSDSEDGVFFFLGETFEEYASIKEDDSIHYYYKVTAVDGSGDESERSTADEGWAITPPIIFNDNFDGTSFPSGWYTTSTFWNYYSSSFWVTPGAAGTDNCFRLDGGYLQSLSEGVFAYRALGQSYQPSYLQIYVKSSSTLEEGGEIVGVGNAASFWIYFSNNGNLYLYGSGGSVNIGGYSSNSWYRLQLKNIDWTAKTYDFYINGVLKMDNMPFANNTATGLSELQLWNDEPGCDFFFDEFFMW